MISTSSLNTGGAKPWPHTSWCSVSTRSGRRYSGASGPSVCRRRSSVGGVQPFLRHLDQRLLEHVELVLGDRAAGRHRMAAEAQQHAGVALGHQVQRIAQVKAGDRAARALELVLLARRLAGREHEGRAVQLVLDARGDDAHHAFVEVGVEHADGGGRLLAFVEQRFHDLHRLLAHAALDVAALAVDRVQRARQLVAARRVVGQQAFDAQRHVRQPAGGVDARAEREAEVERGGDLRVARRRREQAGQPAGQGAGADALQALGDQPPVVGVELDHVGHGAQRHQRQQAVELGLGLLVEHAALRAAPTAAPAARRTSRPHRRSTCSRSRSPAGSG